MFQYRQVLVRMRQGDSDRDIARSRLMGRRKAAALRRVVQARGWLDPATPLPDDAALAAVLGTPARAPTCVSTLEPLRPLIAAWFAERVQATTIHAALVERHGFKGSYSAVRRFVRALAAAQPAQCTTTRLDFAPAEAAQVDFGAGPRIVDVTTGETFKTWVFVMTLCWSRHQYAEVVKIDACPPRDPQKKGIVESGVKYLKRAWMPLRSFRDLADANRQLHDWLLASAGTRCHGTTRCQPLERFTTTERGLLGRLPDVPPELATWASVVVHRDAHVQFDRALYSVPFRLMSQTLWLRATASAVQIYRDTELVATHVRTAPGQRATVRDHLPPDALAWSMADPQHCLRESGYRTVKTILAKGLELAPIGQSFDRLANTYTTGGRFTRGTHRIH